MRVFTFITAAKGALRILADSYDHAWDVFESQGFMRGDCLEVLS